MPDRERERKVREIPRASEKFVSKKKQENSKPI